MDDGKELMVIDDDPESIWIKQELDDELDDYMDHFVYESKLSGIQDALKVKPEPVDTELWKQTTLKSQVVLQALELNSAQRDYLQDVLKQLTEYQMYLTQRLSQLESEEAEFEFESVSLPLENEPRVQHWSTPITYPLPTCPPSSNVFCRFLAQFATPYFKVCKFPAPLNSDAAQLLSMSMSTLEQSSEPWTLDQTRKLSNEVKASCRGQVDWLRVAARLQGRSHRECIKMWELFGKSEWKKGPWTKEEDAALAQLAEEHCKQDWRTIASLLPCPRSPYQTFIRYISRNPRNSKCGKWTPEEDEHLKRLIQSCRFGQTICWRKVMYYVEDRNFGQVYTRWCNSLCPGIKKGKFTDEEDLVILDCMAKGMGTRQMAALLGNRNPTQVREKYREQLAGHLDKKIGEWSLSEDELLLELVGKFGETNWSEVANQFTSRSRVQTRHRYRLLKSKMQQPGFELSQIKRRLRSSGKRNHKRNVEYVRVVVEGGGEEEARNWKEQHLQGDVVAQYLRQCQAYFLEVGLGGPEEADSLASDVLAVLGARLRAGRQGQRALDELKDKVCALLAAMPQTSLANEGSLSSTAPALPPNRATYVGWHVALANLNRLCSESKPPLSSTSLTREGTRAQQLFKRRLRQLFALPALLSVHPQLLTPH